MNTRLLMTASALVMGLLGLFFEFLPHELLDYTGAAAANPAAPVMQIAGALLLGFAMTNWMARGVVIGGIYARPLAMGNFVHFLVGALALLKFAFSGPNMSIIWATAIIYSLFAVLFGIVSFTHPAAVKLANI
jgi:hypothetical protein